MASSSTTKWAAAAALLACLLLANTLPSLAQETAVPEVLAAAAAANPTAPRGPPATNGTTDPAILEKIPPLDVAAAVTMFVPGPLRARHAKDGSLTPVMRKAMAGNNATGGDSGVVSVAQTGDRITNGNCLVANGVNACIFSSNGRFRLCMQADANVVLYDGTRAYWASNTWRASSIQPMRLCMQADANLVAYDGTWRALWASNTWGRPNGPFTTYIQNDGNMVLYDSRCSAYWATGTMMAAGVPPPCSAPPPATGGCPAGWSQAVGTLFDSWPKPGTTECVAYSGCRWAGLFSEVVAGWCQGPCQSARGRTAQPLNGGDGTVCCRWPEPVVREWSVAATWERDPELLNSRLEVMVQGGNGRTVTVNVLDKCSDTDCNGCCSRNTGNGRYKLIDIEKWPASALLGFDHSSPTFDINSVAKPNAVGRRPGAPETSVMPLCYRRV